MKKKVKTKLSPKTLKFRRNFCLISFLFLVLIVGTFLSLTVLFKIENISVTGYTNYESNEIINCSLISKGTNLFCLNTRKSAENIKKSLPYIEEVQIMKKIPSDVTIKVTQSKPSWAIENEGEYVLINNQQKVLEISSDLPDSSLCIIKGTDLNVFNPGENLVFKDQQVGNVLTTLMNLFSKYNIGANEICMSDFSKITFSYENRINVIIGIPEKLDYKIKTAVHILKENIKEQEHGTLDLSLVLENEHSYFTPE